MATISQLSARLIDIFGSPATADPTKLLGNFTVSPAGRILIGTSTDDGSNKLQINGATKITGALAVTTTLNVTGTSTLAGATFSSRPTFNGATPYDTANFNPASYMPTSGGAFSAAISATNISATGAMTSTGGYNVGNGSVLLIYDTGGSGTIGFRTGGTPKFFSLDSGGNGNALNGTWVNGSDIRLKTNVVTIDDALAKICSMRGVYYEKKDQPGVRQVGVIAQETQTAFPEVVYNVPIVVPPDSDELEHDDYLGVSYGNLVGPLIEAIKILTARVESLEQQLAAKG